MGLAVIDKLVDLSLVKEVKCDFVLLGRVVIGVGVVLVGLDDIFPLARDEIH